MWKLRALVSLLFIIAPVAHARAAASRDSTRHAALHLCIGDVGISFGNAPRVHGLRFTADDRGLERVNGLNLALVSTHGSPNSRVFGVAVNVLGGAYPRGIMQGAWGIAEAPWICNVDGFAVSPFGIGVERSRGILLTAITASARRATGIQLAGLGLEIERSTGIQAASLAVLGKGPYTGITVSGIATFTGGPMTGLNAGTFLWASSLTGINAGAFVVAKRVRGITAGGMVVDDSMSVGGITAAVVIGAPPWMGGEVGPSRVGGLSAAAVVEVLDLAGVSVAGYNRVTGVQRGVTIGLFNDARSLHGVQLGVLNRAANNPGAFRLLPVANAHWGR